jgi:hypothetical protein
MGRHRRSAEQEAAVIEARRKHPDAPQIEIAQQAVVSRSNVWRIAWVQAKKRVMVGFHCRNRGRCSCVCSRSSWRRASWATDCRRESSP